MSVAERPAKLSKYHRPGSVGPPVDGVRRPQPLLAVGSQLVVRPRRAEVQLADTVATGQHAQPVPLADHLDRQPLAPGGARAEPAGRLQVVDAPVASHTWRP